MEQYQVNGMSCAACVARVEKAVGKVEGVTSCSVSLLTNSMGIEGTASPEAIIQAVDQAGYQASKKGQGALAAQAASPEDALKDRETPKLKKRLFTSLGFLILLMYVSMGHTMFHFPLPAFFEDNPIGIGLLEMLLTIIVMAVNKKFFTSGFKSLFHGAPNMDTLVALGAAAAFTYSTIILFVMSRAVADGNTARMMKYMHEFYFESAAMILTLITVGKMLEARSKGKTTDALKGLMKLAPKTAVILRGEQEVTVPVEEVQKGDLFVVKPGENIPVDGVVIEGSSAVNESALTGESIPADKTAGDKVSAATVSQSGFLKCRAEKVGQDTTLSQIIQMVSDAAATKAPIAKIADKVSGVFVPTVITIAVITTFIWLFAGRTIGFALARGISVLVISCPCALGLATPVAIMVGNGMGAKNGIMFKTAASLEATGRTEIVALDKTGTITRGEPGVTDIVPAEGVKEEQLLHYAVVLEKRSEHPLALAIADYGRVHGSGEEAPVALTDFEVRPGNGLRAMFEGEEICGGNAAFIGMKAEISKKMSDQAKKLAMAGKTPMYFAKGGKLLGMIAVADVMKEDSKEAIAELKNMGIRVVMLTGDNEQTAGAIGAQAGVDEVIAGVLPNGKAAVITELKKQGKTVMVGDGINDAPALTVADTGIAIGAGTDIAIDAADVVLMKSSLKDVPAAIRLSRATLRNIHENLFWAFIYNIIGIPLAAGVWIPLFGWTLNPMFGAAAMSLSSFCVVTNALRLNLCRIYDAAGDKKIKSKKLEKVEVTVMEKTMKIEGMMCGHCEATVKKALEALPEVTEAKVSHTEGTAVVTLASDIDSEVLKKTVEDKDYKVLEIV